MSHFLSGKVLHIGFPSGGCKNDMNLFAKDKDFISQLDQEFETIIGDKGFRGLDFIFPNIADKRNNYQKEKDKAQKSIRIIIENVFARMKQFYMTSLSLRYKFKIDDINMDPIFEKHHKVWCGYLINKYSSIRNNDYDDDVELDSDNESDE